ncbi:MAG: hypothetical protein GXZ14_01200 [Ruminococcaceae bacterium]|nr:hypothetical protein [Oscillospiraceae bacterium]
MQEKNVTKQVIVRFFAPDMHKLKVTAKQLSVTSPDLKLGLYGQADEILVVLNAQSYAEAAAMQLTESGAQMFEDAMGDYSYGRGKGGLAYVTAGELMEARAYIAAGDEETGALLETEVKATKRGDKVFDFGDDSYLNDKVASKIEKAAIFDPNEATPAYQAAADWATAAAKCTKSEFGAAIKGFGEEKLYAAIAHGKFVYVREIPASKDAEKCAALTLLDMTRRLLIGAGVPYAQSCKAGQELEWEGAPAAAVQTRAPQAKAMQSQAKASKKSVAYSANDDEDDYVQKPKKKKKPSSSAGVSNKIVPIIVLVVLLVALVFAGYYLLNTFFFNKTGSDKDASTSSSSAVSMAQSVADSTTPQDGAAPADSTPISADGAAASITTDAPAEAASNTGVVHPFG